MANPTLASPRRSRAQAAAGKKVATVDVTLGNQTLSIQKKDILHVLMQEMIRIKQWQRDVPQESSVRAGEHAGPGPGRTSGNDPTYDVVTIKLPQGILCTYGEMNTLADYFGSVDVLETAGKTQVWQLLQSVRERDLVFLNKAFYAKVAASLTRQEAGTTTTSTGLDDQHFNEILLPDLMDGGGFQDATAARISGLWRPDRAAREDPEARARRGRPTSTSRAWVATPATSCPRAGTRGPPEPQEGVVPSPPSRRRPPTGRARPRTSCSDDQTSSEQEKPADGRSRRQKAISADKANEALMTNGFGDHFLQDSYAAGHMINKTQIMQFYVEFIDKNNEWDYFKDANWRKVQNIAYGQDAGPRRAVRPEPGRGLRPANGALEQGDGPPVGGEPQRHGRPGRTTSRRSACRYPAR